MKLKPKVWLIVGVLPLIFIVGGWALAQYLFIQFPTTPPLVQSSINYFFLLNSIVIGLGLLLINVVFLQRFDKLQRLIAKNKTRKVKHIKLRGDDELSSIAAEINALNDTVSVAHNEIQRISEETKALSNNNHNLRAEVLKQSQNAKQMVMHKEYLARLAHYDVLTNLPNRMFFNEVLNKAINHAKRHNTKIALLFIDVDGFKIINDAFGHNTADGILKKIAQRFSKVLRAGDVLARFGGDEFIILLKDVEKAKYAGNVAEKLLQSCSKSIMVNKNELLVTASIGVAVYPEDGSSLEELEHNVDMAMYQSKRAGGGIFNYYTKQLNTEAHQHIQLETALRKALVNNEFSLHFQPKMDLLTAKIKGVEALLRWESPENGLMTPSQFLDLAEDTSLIVPIGEWVIRQACKINREWIDEGFEPIMVTVNLSKKQFNRVDIVSTVKTTLDEFSLPPELLGLEIPIDVLTQNTPAALDRIEEFKRLGVKIAIEDFGVEHSNFQLLTNLHGHILKLDKKFIKCLTKNEGDDAVTKAMIAMAHSLGMIIVAEGVETREQWEFLAINKCDLAQGYYISRPLPEKKVVLMFSKQEDLAKAL